MDSNKKYNGIVIFGEMAVGKDTLADFLISEDKRCDKYNIGYAVRQFFPILKINNEYANKDRVLGQKLADALRTVYPDILNDYCLSRVYTKWENIFSWESIDAEEQEYKTILMDRLHEITKKEIPIIVGGRTELDFEYWSNMNFLTIGIVCDFETKYTRLSLRDGELAAKNSNFKHNTESEVGNIAKNKCEMVLDNSNSLEMLYEAGRKILKMF